MSLFYIDGEHFFLEPDQKLEKFAPTGWRGHNRHILNARILYTLYLRVKFYPITLDFVKLVNKFDISLMLPR